MDSKDNVIPSTLNILNTLNHRLMNNWRPLARSTLEQLGLLAFVRQLFGRKPDGSRPSNSPAQASPVANADVQSSSPADAQYAARLAVEQNTFANNINVHDLPQIYHYWSNKYLLPAHRPFGFTCPDSFYCLYLEQQIANAGSASARFVSVGAGNCDTEVRLATMLKKRGHENFTIECLDINDDMLARGRKLADEVGVVENIVIKKTDFNQWQPKGRYDAVIANQSLHHVEQLEGLFTRIKSAIGDSGIFLTSDMIGRNGHMRWPEALEIVQEFWRELPPKYRHNQQLNRYEQEFDNWDCSDYGFEGIRAQDILPLLISNFHFSAFFAFANVIDPFIDRSFGHNFDVNNEGDRGFIDRVALRDEAELRAGLVKPTHILAAMCATPVTLEKFIAPFTPEFSVRPVDT